jgi:hypothetical protein
LRAAFQAFREPALVTNILDSEDFEDFETRKMRYQIFFGFYENTVYREVAHRWAKKYKADHGLYKYIRNIYNPAYRLCEFHHTHLYGGRLDPKAGNGLVIPSAEPIITENERLRPALAQLWRDSNWGINKDIMTLYGPIMGDFGLRVIDDPAREKVYIDVVHPRMIKSVDKDRFGNVKAYELEEEREDPDNPNRRVLYNETAERDGDFVVFRTFKDGVPYDWEPGEDSGGEDSGGGGAEWAEPYGFVPFVHGLHNNVGMDYGWSELHPFRSKVHEVDDLASKLDDQIRKIVDPIWLGSGMSKPKKDPKTEGAEPTDERPQPGREEVPILYADKDARIQAFVADLDIAAVSSQINDILKEIERDYPELQSDIWTPSGEVSGRAIRVARQRTESKMIMRRVNYDRAVVSVQQMAIAIGGEMGYEGYGGFNLESFDKGDLDHLVGPRPVFTTDPLDDTEIERAFWETASIAVSTGIPLEVHLKRQGWTEEEIAEVTTVNRRAQAIGERGAQQSLLEAVGQQMRDVRERRQGEPPASGEETQ